MMPAKQIIIVLLVTFICACGGNKVTVYSCLDATSAESCSDKCTKPESFNLSYSFITDKDSKSVMMVAYKGSEQIGSVTSENCKIFSNENWDCSTYMPYGSNTYKMTNGIFSQYTTFKDQTPSAPSHAACAK